MLQRISDHNKASNSLEIKDWASLDKIAVYFRITCAVRRSFFSMDAVLKRDNKRGSILIGPNRLQCSVIKVDNLAKTQNFESFILRKM